MSARFRCQLHSVYVRREGRGTGREGEGRENIEEEREKIEEDREDREREEREDRERRKHLQGQPRKVDREHFFV